MWEFKKISSGQHFWDTINKWAATGDKSTWESSKESLSNAKTKVSKKC